MPCVFCDVVKGNDDKSPLIYQDEELVAFRDIKPATKHHYLICSKEHIQNAKALRKEHISLVKRMTDVALKVLEEQGGETSGLRMGFHWPPFHLIAHLHLHVIAPESEMSWLSRAIFKSNSFWFVSPEYVIDRLENLPD